MNSVLRNTVIAVGVVFFVVFLALSVDSVRSVTAGRTPPLTPAVVEGKAVWQRKDCIGCHTILGNGSYFAPDLTKEYSARGREWLRSFLADPGSAVPEMGGVKPSSDESAALIEFLKWVDGVDTNGWPPKPGLSLAVSAGEAIVNGAGCMSCHRIGDTGKPGGIDLGGVGSRRNAGSLRSLLRDPAPGMPPVKGLSDAEMDRLVEWLEGLK